MQVVADQIRSVPEETDNRPGPTYVFRHDGPSWAIGEEGNVFYLEDTVGVRCLAQLVRQPGKKLSAAALLAASGSRTAAEGRCTAARARANATAVVRGAIRRIAANDRPLARHLTSSVRTGRTCRYQVDQEAPVVWRC